MKFPVADTSCRGRPAAEVELCKCKVLPLSGIRPQRCAEMHPTFSYIKSGLIFLNTEISKHEKSTRGLGCDVLETCRENELQKAYF